MPPEIVAVIKCVTVAAHAALRESRPHTAIPSDDSLVTSNGTKSIPAALSQLKPVINGIAQRLDAMSFREIQSIP
jgi:hypothetical protein